MKNYILLLALTFATGAYCENPYQNGSTVTADGITFEVDFRWNGFLLSNTANIYAGEANWRYKDGRELETEDEYAVIDGSMKPGVENLALRKSLPDSVILSLRSYKYSPMTIFYVIGPDGDTLEVSFIMNAVPELLSLPPETFALLEHNLKKYVKWEVNKYGQQLEFMQTSSFVHFQKVPLNSEVPPRNPNIGGGLDSNFDTDLGGDYEGVR